LSTLNGDDPAIIEDHIECPFVDERKERVGKGKERWLVFESTRGYPSESSEA